MCGVSMPVARILGDWKVDTDVTDVVEAIGDPELAWVFRQNVSREHRVPLPEYGGIGSSSR